MLWWPRLRASMRAIGHGAIVAGPLAGLFVAQSTAARLACVALAVIGVAAAVWAAVVYIPGFDPLFRIPWRGKANRRRIALTFDDGPNGAFTEEVLALFRRYGGRATFFLVGRAVETQPELARRIAAEGHAVGSHTYSHQKLHLLSRSRMRDEIDRGHACLTAAGVRSDLFRAPHGLKTFSMMRHLRRRGLRLIAWTDGVFDYDGTAADVITERALPKLRPGEILLLHDGAPGRDRRPLVDALDNILRTCRERGLELVTVPELLG